MNRLPYGTRLTIAYTAIFAVALLTFSGVAFAAVHVNLQRQLDARLATTATAAHSVPDIRGGRLVFDEDDRRQFLEILADNHVNGLTVTRAGDVLLSNLARPPRALLTVAGGNTTRTGAMHADNDTIAYIAEPIFKQDRRYGAVLVWSSRTLNDEVARTTLAALLAASLLVIGIAGLAGGTLIRRMLRPITDLSAMMSEIEVADLSERLAWTGPDDELARLCATFDRLLDRLEAAFERERRFTADASHELRTPITVMRAEIELALSRNRDTAEYREALQRLQRETARLEALAQSLLLSARHEALPIAATPVDVLRALSRAGATMLPLLRARDVTLRIDGARDVYALAESTSLERAFVALFDNALRFSPDGADIRVEIGIEGDAVSLEIVDEGPGFSAAALRDATRRFWRDDPARSGMGTGLGLSIVRAIVERYQGSIVLSNATPHGAIVTVRLPYVRAAAAVAPSG